MELPSTLGVRRRPRVNRPASWTITYELDWRAAETWEIETSGIGDAAGGKLEHRREFVEVVR